VSGRHRAAIVRSANTVEVEGRLYMLVLPNHSVSRGERIHLRLRTSRARDQVYGAELRVGSVLHDLGRHAHNRELLALAVARDTDAANQRPPEECGWRSTQRLATLLHVDRSVLNVWTFRLRQVLRQCGVELLQDEPNGRNGSRRRLAECDIEFQES
jgi:hypothetical protein